MLKAGVSDGIVPTYGNKIELRLTPMRLKTMRPQRPFYIATIYTWSLERWS